MSVITLNRNNKNQYRRYPLKQTTSMVSSDGFILPDELITSCSITATYGKHRIYIRQIFYKNSEIRITISSVFDDTSLGVFQGVLTQDFTTIQLTPFEKFISGSMTIGPLRSIAGLDRILNFTSEATELEESTIFCYTPPAVTNILDKKRTELRGNVNFGVLTNLTKHTENNSSNLQATFPKSIFNVADKSSYIGTCATPTINNINGVTPFPAGEGSSVNDNNIYIAGVKPIIFFGVQDTNNTFMPGAIGIDTGSITLDSLCTQKHKLLPPINVSGFTLETLEYKNMYYSKPALSAAPSGNDVYPLPRPERLASNFNATTKPEYYYWPQFVKEEYYSYWFTPKI